MDFMIANGKWETAVNSRSIGKQEKSEFGFHDSIKDSCELYTGNSQYRETNK